MGRILALVALVVASFGVPSHATSLWAVAAEKVQGSVVSVQLEQTDHEGNKQFGTSCSGFAIDESRGLFMTAQHCRGEGRLGVNHEIAWVVYENEPLDLMVLQSMGVRVTALLPRTNLVVTGLDIAAVGFAYGFEVPMFRPGVVSNPFMLIPTVKEQFPTRDGKFMVLNITVIGGMSGGPIVDTDGRIVGIIQMGDLNTALGQPIEVILKATGAFWAAR